MLRDTKHPVYVISKNRHDCCLTANFMIKDGLHFYLVIEPDEYEKYRHYEKHEECMILLLPFNNLGLGSIPARNWVWEHSKANGDERHWIFDDNIRMIQRRYKGLRIPCNVIPAIKTCEQFISRYSNIAIAGMNYGMFAPDRAKIEPYRVNNHVYSCLCIDNSLKQRWRGRYNEDTDLCLQVLTDKYCTVQFNAFTIAKMQTMVMKGGNSDKLYKDNGRLKMARSLEMMWPKYVETKWRFGRPQHVVRWNLFTHKLLRKKDVPKEEPIEFKLKVKSKCAGNHVKMIMDDFRSDSTE